MDKTEEMFLNDNFFYPQGTKGLNEKVCGVKTAHKSQKPSNNDKNGGDGYHLVCVCANQTSLVAMAKNRVLCARTHVLFRKEEQTNTLDSKTIKQQRKKARFAEQARACVSVQGFVIRSNAHVYQQTKKEE